MAKVRMPLLSGTAQGTIGRALSFVLKKGGQYVKRFQRPFICRTSGQDLMRKRFAVARTVWRALNDTQKILWGNYINIGPSGQNAPFNKVNLNTGYPCRETPELPGFPYRRKVEFIIGLAKIGITPIGITETQLMRYE
jgi:hypothetical protein